MRPRKGIKKQGHATGKLGKKTKAQPKMNFKKNKGKKKMKTSADPEMVKPQKQHKKETQFENAVDINELLMQMFDQEDEFAVSDTNVTDNEDVGGDAQDSVEEGEAASPSDAQPEKKTLRKRKKKTKKSVSEVESEVMDVNELLMQEVENAETDDEVEKTEDCESEDRPSEAQHKKTRRKKKQKKSEKSVGDGAIVDVNDVMMQSVDNEESGEGEESEKTGEGDSSSEEMQLCEKKKRSRKRKRKLSSAADSDDEGEEGETAGEPEDSDGDQDEASKTAKGINSEAASTWGKLGVSAALVRALLEDGMVSPTPIQAQALPHAIDHRLDIVGAAQTGSGKTLAFGLPILEYILRNNLAEERDLDGPVALILEPTRELAMQVHKHLKSAARHTPIKIVTLVGGLAAQKQSRLLKRRPHIVVATPGRLWELIDEGEPHLQHLEDVRQFVMDEADRMMEKGHFEELHKVVNLITRETKISFKRQHYIFSATLTLDHEGPRRQMKKKQKKEKHNAKQKLESLVAELDIQGKPKVIDLTTSSATVDTLTETRINCQRTEKDLYLFYLLRSKGGRTLVFCNSKDCIRRLVSVFSLLGCSPLPLHSDMHQRQRLKNLDRFAERPRSVLLASDVAARGLDIRGVDHVVHYQVPFTVENYVHRSGRTARASREGLSVVLVSPDETRMYRHILKLKQGEDLPPYPVETHVVKTLKTYVDLAAKIDIEEHRLKKASLRTNWIQQAAKEMDLAVDDDLMEEEGGGREQQQLKAKLRQQKQQLAAMLKQPVLPSGFSSRYPTQSGHLLLPQH